MVKSEIDPTFNSRLKIIGVMGSGTNPHRTLSLPLGRMIAKLGCHLLTGGGEGVMEAVSEAFFHASDRKGQVIGVIRAGSTEHLGPEKKLRHYKLFGPPNPWVEIPIFTHLPHSGSEGKEDLSRNHINVLSSDVVIVLPGESGTLSEVELAIEYQWPLILFLGAETINGRQAASFQRDYPGSIQIAADVGEVERKLKSFLRR